ncbi:NADH-quinone oxidoreductase subunit NuoF [Mycoplasmatota bacterium]|nr:NADH-quinone oxidoreductase subunit NuoF [Mycoplasmatota bacterium]
MIRSSEELVKRYNETKGKILNRAGLETNGRKEVLVCGVAGCKSLKSDTLVERLREAISDNGLDIEVKETGCFGFCEKGPIVKVMPEDIFYSQVNPKDINEIVESHLVKGEVYKKKLYINPETKKAIETTKEIPFYKKQVKIALRNCGFINAESIDEYIGAGGYQALAKALEMTPQEVIEVIKESGLRGRGGGGFPTGIKWQFARNNESQTKYIICNADEGDPGAFMDRSILEGDPHSVIEAMAIGAYAIGANFGYVYVRAEYPQAVERLELAIEKAKREGLLGKDILATGFNFDLEIRLGAGAFVCGEETALIASIEGERGMPRTKPPFPASKGLWGAPTIINNVETFAVIPEIIKKGSEWFKGIGTKKSSGTKVFALVGKVKNTGLIEVPMGITLREIIYDIGGGMLKGRKFKAVLTGGPSGGCLTEEHLDEIVDFDRLKELGSMMGSGGMIVLDDKNCMVDIAKFYIDFMVEESCGKCTPCREGTIQMYNILNNITSGKATLQDIDLLESLAESTVSTSLCGLGQTAPNPILSTLEYFKDEYIEHIEDKRCSASVCKDLINEYIITDKCTGCTICAKNCPVECISGERKEKHTINKEKCILCGDCFNRCPFDAIVTR